MQSQLTRASPFTTLRVQMYSFVVNSGFIFTHLLNVSEKYSSICIFDIQPNQPVIVKAVIPEITVVSDISVPSHVYASVVDVHVSECPEQTTTRSISSWDTNHEHLQFSVSMEKLYDWLRYTINSSDQLQFTFYCWGEKNLIQMYSVFVLNIPTVNKSLKQGAKHASLYNILSPFLIPKSSTASQTNRRHDQYRRKNPKPILKPSEPFRLTVNEYNYSQYLDSIHFHKLVHKWHEGLIDENDEELDDKNFQVQKKGKKGPKTNKNEGYDMEEEEDEEEPEEMDQDDSEDDNHDGHFHDDDDDGDDDPNNRTKNDDENENPVDKPKNFMNPNKNKRKHSGSQLQSEPQSNSIGKKTKNEKQIKTKKIRERRPLFFLSRPFVDKFLYVRSSPPKQSSITLKVSTTEFHSICRDLSLGGNVVNMMRAKQDDSFYLLTNGEPGVVVFEFLKNFKCSQSPRVPLLFQPNTDLCAPKTGNSDLKLMNVPEWFQDLKVPSFFQLLKTDDWSHLPTCVDMLKSIREQEQEQEPSSSISRLCPSSSSSSVPYSVPCSVQSEKITQSSYIDDHVPKHHSQSLDINNSVTPSYRNRLTGTQTHNPNSDRITSNLQSCYSLEINEKVEANSGAEPDNKENNSKTKESSYLLRLMKMCTKEFSSKSLSSFPYVQLDFTPGRYLVLSLSEPVINHGMSIHVYISPVL